ncbi:MAG: TrbI/VirB10 family protein [Polyangiaceae bacterium]
MTSVAIPEQERPAEPAVDPHAPKLSPDDPRLRLARPQARTLRSGPIAILVGCLLGAVMLAVALAFESPSRKVQSAAEPSAAPAPPAVPDTIRNAGAHRASLLSMRDAGWGEHEVRAAGPADPAEREARDLDQKARGAGILFASPAGPDERGLPTEPGVAPRAGSLEGEAPSAAPAPSVDPNLQDRKNAFLSGKGGVKHADYLDVALQHPRSPNEIKAGTVLPAVLITAINSDLPGPVVAQVREHVYDTVSGNTLLVPQGSRLIAQYDSMVAWGQERVLLCWQRLVLPNGDSMDLQCMPAADLKGAAGLADEVDEHWWRILKGAAVATLLAAGTAYAAGDTTAYNPTVGQVTVRSASGEIGTVGAQLTRNNLSVQPTITVRPGFSVNVIVTKDMIVPPYPDPPTALGLRHE